MHGKVIVRLKPFFFTVVYPKHPGWTYCRTVLPVEMSVIFTLFKSCFILYAVSVFKGIDTRNRSAPTSRFIERLNKIIKKVIIFPTSVARWTIKRINSRWCICVTYWSTIWFIFMVERGRKSLLRDSCCKQWTINW